MIIHLLKNNFAVFHNHLPPHFYQQFCLSQKNARTFCKNITRLLRTHVSTDIGHFSVSQVINCYRLSTPFYRHCLHRHCTLSMNMNMNMHEHDYCSTISSWRRPTCCRVFFQFKAKSRTFLEVSIACRFLRTVKQFYLLQLQLQLQKKLVTAKVQLKHFVAIRKPTLVFSSIKHESVTFYLTARFIRTPRKYGRSCMSPWCPY